MNLGLEVGNADIGFNKNIFTKGKNVKLYFKEIWKSLNKIRERAYREASYRFLLTSEEIDPRL